MTTGGDKFYALSLDKNNENIGFYWITSDGSAFMNGAHKAYLAISDVSNVKSFYTFSEAESSGLLNEVIDYSRFGQSSEEFSNDIYDLSGRKLKNLKTQELKNLRPGLYIVNGTKVYIK